VVVHEAQRVVMLSTQRTDVASTLPCRYSSHSSPARAISWSSVRRRRFSDWASRSSIVVTHSASSARLNRSGIITITLPSRRYAETVRLRRLERRTSTPGDRSLCMEKR
jgi:hypothetical protein